MDRPPEPSLPVVLRHDPDNVDIHVHTEQGASPARFELDVYLFVPPLFGVRALSRSELRADLRVRTKASLSRRPSVLRRGFERELKRQTELLMSVEKLKRDAAADESVLAGLRKMALGFEELTMPEEVRPVHFAKHLQLVERAVERIRFELVLRWRHCAPILDDFSDYVGHLHLRYLGRMQSRLDRWEASLRSGSHPGIERELIRDTRRLLKAAIARERELRGKEMKSDAALEEDAFRFSTLKKFFQSGTYCTQKLSSHARTINEGAAALGAGVAGFMAALLHQHMMMGSIANTRVTLEGFGFIAAGLAAAAYVLRDRMKDWVKAQLSERASVHLPDAHGTLLLRDAEVGQVEERFRTTKVEKLPPEVQEQRRNLDRSSLERTLGEDVLHLSRVRKTEPIQAHAEEEEQGFNAFRDHVRINLSRYFRLMDDPTKEMPVLRGDDTVGMRTVRRTYPFHLCVTVRTEGGKPARSVIYRLEMDKDGLREVTRMTAVAPDLTDPFPAEGEAAFAQEEIGLGAPFQERVKRAQV